jgi:hypothetical protein
VKALIITAATVVFWSVSDSGMPVNIERTIGISLVPKILHHAALHGFGRSVF